ncbi:MAG: hypothetical protein HY820_15540 [Acidobacteria bacterium]|nr:hypothetical protein [Acidobacteriota bacterium]
MNPHQRRLCVRQLLAKPFEGSIIPEALYYLSENRLIDDARVVPVLVECLSNPSNDVAKYCAWGLQRLTGGTYGGSYVRPGELTAAARQDMIADWAKYAESMRMGYPIFDQWLAAECQRSVEAIGTGLIDALNREGTMFQIVWNPGERLSVDAEQLQRRAKAIPKGHPIAAGYVRQGMLKNSGVGLSHDGRVFTFDLNYGVSHVSNCCRGNFGGLSVRILRSGLDSPRSKRPAGVESYPDPPSYQEDFPAIDLRVEARFGAAAGALKNALNDAVKLGLARLRQINVAVPASN